MFYIIDQDKPIYQFYLLQPQKLLKQLFILHSSLDSIDYMIPHRKQYYLGLIKSEDIPIYCYVNNTGIKLMLMFNKDAKNYLDKKVDNSIKQFFSKVNQQFSLILLNPLYKLHEQIKFNSFDDKIKEYARQFIKPIIDKKK